MSWWKTALYDTCSLITLDKLLQDRASLSRMFPNTILGLEESFTVEQMYQDIAARIKPRVLICTLPPPTELAQLLSSAGLSKALSDVDTLVFATAVHFGYGVVTGDKPLAKALQKTGVVVGNMALILQELVKTRKLKSSLAEELLQRLAGRKDFLLGIPNPTWNDLKNYTFPD